MEKKEQLQTIENQKSSYEALKVSVTNFNNILLKSHESILKASENFKDGFSSDSNSKKFNSISDFEGKISIFTACFYDILYAIDEKISGLTAEITRLKID